MNDHALKAMQLGLRAASSMITTDLLRQTVLTIPGLDNPEAWSKFQRECQDAQAQVSDTVAELEKFVTDIQLEVLQKVWDAAGGKGDLQPGELMVQNVVDLVKHTRDPKTRPEYHIMRISFIGNEPCLVFPGTPKTETKMLLKQIADLTKAEAPFFAEKLEAAILKFKQERSGS